MYGIIMYYFTNVGLIYMDSFDLYGLPGNTTHYIKKLGYKQKTPSPIQIIQPLTLKKNYHPPPPPPQKKIVIL